MLTLRAEFETGQKRLSALDAERTQLMETMLRISGAIQVLEELAGERAAHDATASNGADGAVTDATALAAKA
jgi:hypothetical protein